MKHVEDLESDLGRLRQSQVEHIEAGKVFQYRVLNELTQIGLTVTKLVTSVCDTMERAFQKFAEKLDKGTGND
jgi:phage terminase Nu1 subunit (DNA packaging protein)